MTRRARASSLRFQFDPLVDLYFLLRTGMERPDSLPPAWDYSVNRMKAAAGHLSGLELPDPDFQVPVFLVANAPEPGSITGRSRRLKAACFVSVVPYPGSTLFEVILHEASHALEVVAGVGTGSVLDRLRAVLQAQGVKATDPLMRDVPHTLMFVHSAETVRRVLDPAHIDYGDSQGYYAKVPHVASVVRSNWVLQLDGQLSANMAIERIVSGVLK